MVVAPSYPILKTSSLRTFVALARQTGKLVAYNKTEFLVTLDSGSQVIFKSGENPDALRGPNISGLWLDEAQGISEEAFNVAIGCLREDATYNWASATFTPRGTKHWTYERFGQEDADGNNLRSDTELFHCSSRDNPFIPDSFVEGLAGQYVESSRLQEIEGKFIDAGGILFKREWFNDQFVNVAPREAMRVRYWDKAATKDAGCATCGTLMCKTPDNSFFVEHVQRGFWSTFQRDEIIALVAELDREMYGYGGVSIWIEQEPGSGGLDSLNASVRGLAGHIVRGDRPTGDKRVRAEPFAAQCERQNVFIVRGSWNRDWIEELVMFPTKGVLCDQVDSASGAFNKLNSGNYGQPVSGGGTPGAPGPGSSLQTAPVIPFQQGGLRNFRPI